MVVFLTTAFWGIGVRGLHNLEINVPSAVLVGETVTLECSWELEEEETLYSVKWYRGREEFYRYIPKELPHTRVFPLRGIDVDISRSGARRVVLQQATPAMAGRFRCEVTADATFHTEIQSAGLEVVELPEWGPKLVSDRSWYGVGSSLHATCASPPAHPPANLTIALNGREIDADLFGHELPEWFKWDPPMKVETSTTEQPYEDDLNFNIFHDDTNVQYLDESYVNLHKEEIQRPPKDTSVFERTGPDYRLPSVGDVSFIVHNDAFEKGSLRVTCIASIYNLYAARAELVFDMEQPEVASVLGVRNGAVGTNSDRSRELLYLGGVTLIWLKLR